MTTQENQVRSDGMTHYLEASRRKLEEAALQYARMKTTGRYIQDGNMVSVGSDRDMYAEQLLAVLQDAAVNLLFEMTAVPLPRRE